MSGPQNLFEYSPATREKLTGEYGRILDHLKPELKGYRAIYIVSSEELLNLDSYENPLKTMEKVFPNSDGMNAIKNEADLEALGKVQEDMLDGARRSRGHANPAAISLKVGTEANPVAVGFLILPEKFNMTALTLMETKNSAMLKSDKPDANRDTKVGDMKAVVVTHEVGHLVQALKENDFEFSSHPKDQNKTPPELQAGETYAQRFAMQRIPAMHQAGLIANPDQLTKDVTNALKIDTFRNLIINGSSWTTRQGETRVIPGIIDHATGFSLKDDPAVPEDKEFPQENAKFLKAADEIRVLRDHAVGGLVDKAAHGQAGIDFNDMYAAIKGDLKNRDEAERQSYGMGHLKDSVRKRDRDQLHDGIKDEAILPFTAGKIFVDMDGVMDALADHLAKKPEISPEAKEIVEGYIQSRDEVLGKPTPASVPIKFDR